MEEVLLHTPVGVRDIYGRECAVKMTIENKINRIFNLSGYHNIQTPTFEYFDIFLYLSCNSLSLFFICFTFFFI